MGSDLERAARALVESVEAVDAADVIEDCVLVSVREWDAFRAALAAEQRGEVCPACYSRDRAVRNIVGEATHGVDAGEPCFDAWHTPTTPAEDVGGACRHRYVPLYGGCRCVVCGHQIAWDARLAPTSPPPATKPEGGEVADGR